MEEKVSVYFRNQLRWTMKSNCQEAGHAVYSSSRLVGQLDARRDLSPASIENNKEWQRCTFTSDDLAVLKSKYYTAHLLAMGMVDEDTKKEWNCPKEIAHVCRYSLKLESYHTQNIMILDGKEYPCRLTDVSVWFFPCELVLLSIEIVDSGVDLNSLTKMHRQWKNWYINYKKFRTGNLDEILKPLAELTKNDVGNNKTSSSKNVINEHEILIDRISNITYKHTKMRQFQVIQIEEKELRNDLLYELGTHSDIGTVNNPNLSMSFKPSDDYFRSIVQENMVSAFSNWKALALNDTFSVLAICDFVSFEGDYRYFEMIYMRCLVQEYYCFNRNNSYREETESNGSKNSNDLAKVEKEIDLMEKYYFYDDMGYDFLPPLMYQAIVKGLGLVGDKKELTDHVKQALREKNRQNKEKQIDTENLSRNKIEETMRLVSILTVLSAAWSLQEMMIALWPCLFNNVIFRLLMLLLSFALIVFIRKKIKRKQ